MRVKNFTVVQRGHGGGGVSSYADVDGVSRLCGVDGVSRRHPPTGNTRRRGAGVKGEGISQHL